jgi:hypothetical protein
MRIRSAASDNRPEKPANRAFLTTVAVRFVL